MISGRRERRHRLVAAEQVLDRRGGDDRARPERVGGDAVPSQLLREAEGAEAHPVLGDRVGEVAAGPLRVEVDRRREGEDVRVRRPRAGGGCRLAEQEGAAAVDVLHQVVALHLDLLGGAEVDRAGVVEADVDAAELRHGLGDRGSTEASSRTSPTIGSALPPAASISSAAV